MFLGLSLDVWKVWVPVVVAAIGVLGVAIKAFFLKKEKRQRIRNNTIVTGNNNSIGNISVNGNHNTVENHVTSKGKQNNG